MERSVSAEDLVRGSQDGPLPEERAQAYPSTPDVPASMADNAAEFRPGRASDRVADPKPDKAAARLARAADEEAEQAQPGRERSEQDSSDRAEEETSEQPRNDAGSSGTTDVPVENGAEAGASSGAASSGAGIGTGWLVGAGLLGAGALGFGLSGGSGGRRDEAPPAPPATPNRAPNATADTAAATEDAAAVTGSVATNDSDADGDTLSYALSAPVTGLTFNSNGSYSFDPANAAYQNLKAGETRQVVANYTVSDGKGGTATSTLTITVTGSNDAPVATADIATATEDAAAVTGSVATNDSDVDGDPLTYALAAPVAGLTLNANGSYSFDPADAAYQDLEAGETRVVVANYTVADGKGGSATSTLTITVTGTNDAPVAVADTAAATEDGPVVTGSVATNDTDVEGDPLSYILNAPVAGLTFDTDGSYSFDPSDPAYQRLKAGETRDVVANYQVTDSKGGIAASTLTITVTGTNDAPEARPESYTVNEDSALVLTPGTGLLANDSDPDGDPLTAALVSGPTNGTLALNADGSFTYTPNANYNGPDSFVYRAEDGQGGATPVTVNINVQAIDDRPVARPDTASATEDGAVVTGTVAANDSDADGDPLTYSLDAPVAGLTLNADGSYSFDPSNAAYQDLKAGETRVVVANYTATDGNPGPGSSTLTITVTGTNDAPVAVADAYTVAEDSTLVIAAAGVLTNDIDVDGDPLGAILVGGPANGTLAFTTDGSFTYTPNAGYNGPDGFTYRVNDGSLDSAPVTVALTVAPVNDAPIAVADTDSATEDGAIVTGSVATNDSDIDSGTLVFALDAPVAGLTLRGDGSYSFDPSNAAYQNLAAGESRDVVASYTVSDGNGGTDTSTLTITVTGTNDAPVATADTASAIEDSAVATGSVATNDSDVDGDALTYKLDAAVAGLTLNADGSYSFDPSNTAYQNLKAGETRNVVASYTVSDGQGGTATSTFTIAVTGTNDAPVAVADTNTAIEDGALVTGSVATNDSDVDGDTFTYSLVAPVAGLTLGVDGSYSFDPSDAAYQGLKAGETRDVVASYTVSDGNGGTATSTLTITVTGINDAPISTADAYAVDEDTTLVVTAPGVLGNDSDADGDTLRAFLVSGPANGNLTFNADGSFSYTPNANYNGTDSFTYLPNDGRAGTPAVTVTITVNPVNDAPVANPDGASVVEGARGIFGSVAVNDSDIENDPLTYALVAPVAGLNLDPDGDYTFNPSDAAYESLKAGEVRNVVATYTVSDGNGGTATSTLTITVTGTNDAPVAVEDSNNAVEDSTIVNGSVATNDSDIDGDMLTYALNGAVAGLTFNSDGSYSFDPSNAAYQNLAAGETRDVVASYTVSDGNGGTDTSTLTITVTGTNDAPVAVADSGLTTDATVLNVTAASGLLVNDTDADNGAVLAITGVNGSAAAVGTQITLASGALLTVNVDGSYSYDPNGAFLPAAGTTASDSFTYTVSDGTASDTATVTLTISPSNVAPTANADSYSGITGNTPITYTAAQGVLANDTDPDAGDTLSVTHVNGTAIGSGPIAVTNGTVSMNADGSFTFTPATGFNGTASFDYTMRDASGETSTSSATLGVSGKVWYVDSSAAAGGDGSYANPFQSLAPLNGANGAGDVDGVGDTIFVYRGAAISGGISLEAGQKLYGDGHAFTVNGNSIGNSASNSLVNYTSTDSANYGVILSTNNEIRGFTFSGGSSSSIGLQDGGGTVGTLTISNTSFQGSGKAIDIDQGGTLNVSLDNLSSSNSESEGVHLQGLSGTFSAAGGTIINSTGSAFQIGSAGVANSGGNIAVSYGGNIVNAANSSTYTVSVHNRTGGSVTFSGNISEDSGPGIHASQNAGTINFTGAQTLNTGSNTAVFLTNNTGTINFNTSGTGLDIATTSNANAFVATGGGTINVTGAGNTISAQAGAALTILNTNIGANDVTFQSISAGTGSNTAGYGIMLENTGSAGGLHVTGTGPAGSGGTIQRKTGADNDGIANQSSDESLNLTNPQGTGIFLRNTADVQLNNMQLNDMSNFAIYGETVAGFTLTNSTISGVNGTTHVKDPGLGSQVNVNEGAVRFDDLTGNVVVSGNRISGGLDDNFKVVNYSTGSLNFTASENIFGATQAMNTATASGGSNLLLASYGGGAITALVDQNDFNGSVSNAVRLVMSNGGTGNFTVTGNEANNLLAFDSVNNRYSANGATVGGNIGIVSENGSHVVFNVANNIVLGAVQGAAISVDSINATVNGSINNNRVGDPTLMDSGSVQGGGIFFGNVMGGGNQVIQIDGNSIHRTNGQDIWLNLGDEFEGAGGGPQSRVDARVTNNVINSLGSSATTRHNILINAGVTSANGGDDLVLNLHLAGNNLTGTNGGVGHDIRLQQRFETTVILNGYTGAPNDNNAVIAFLKAQNTAPATVSATNNLTGSPPGSGFVNGPLPTAPSAPTLPPAPLMASTTGWTEDVSELEQDQLGETIAAAIARWEAAGATADQLAAMKAVDFAIADMSGSYLAQYVAGTILIDDDAAGHGWFVDPTPGDDAEFAATADGLKAAGGDTASQIDLLSVVMHELGHAAGIGHSAGEQAAGDLMAHNLDTGERRLPELSGQAGDRFLEMSLARLYLDGDEGPSMDELLSQLGGFDAPAGFPAVQNAAMPDGSLSPAGSFGDFGTMASHIVDAHNVIEERVI